MVLRLHGYGAWIESDGKPLEEHAVKVEGNVISCYVCSEEGKNFVLHFDDDGSHYSGSAAPLDCCPGRAVYIDMDGSRVDALWGDFKGKLTSRGLLAGATLRPYTFAPVDTTDDDDVAKDNANNELIGTIQTELYRGIKFGESVGVTACISEQTEPSVGPIHERSKKAGSHRVALGTGVYSRPRTTVAKVDYIDRAGAPVVTFRFQYRQRDMLKAQGIIPQSPIPPPSPCPSVGTSAEVKKGKGVKREREENGNDVIEIFSEDEDLDSLQDELKRIQDRIARKRANRSVKREAVSADALDLT